MSEEKTGDSKVQVTAKAAARSLFDLYEPDLSTDARAQEFLVRLRVMSEPPAVKSFKGFLTVRGPRYYVIFAGVAAAVLVVVIYAVLYALGPAVGYDTRWIIPEAIRLLLIIMVLEYLCAAMVWAYRDIVGGRFAGPPLGHTASQTPEGEPDGERADEATLKRCALELRYLVDTLNDRVGALNQVISYLIPAIVAVQVFSLLLPGADDKTSISIVTFGATLLAGFIVLVFALPIRLIAHGRVTKYRAWLRKVETALLDLSHTTT
jgi:hypothetical protein